MHVTKVNGAAMAQVIFIFYFLPNTYTIHNQHRVVIGEHFGLFFCTARSLILLVIMLPSNVHTQTLQGALFLRRALSSQKDKTLKHHPHPLRLAHTHNLTMVHLPISSVSTPANQMRLPTSSKTIIATTTTSTLGSDSEMKGAIPYQ